ncbi:MAG: 3-hydroxyacyl-CoA dehydrogenase NAD-binding domain-containing protein [Rhodospirillaceae bacterium]|nr:3-hydroxyacyl-CoA dehydrogenase NAD-binding domain-containing protein [Rhodospirillaceae bacterium]
MNIEKVAVIGSGVMGSGIAAQVANAGVPVVLMDIVPEGAANRNALAEGAVARLLKQDPAPFMHPRNARLIEPANLADDLDKLADCDWIIEAVLEDLATKHTVYNKIDVSMKPGAAVTSNTSTIPLARLLDGMSEGFAAGFFITHFFNPPRYLRLLETVSGTRTDPATVAAVSRFCDVRLGKTVIACKDTPGFIANRIGGYWIQSAINGAMDLGLTVEEADAVGGRPMGVPRTGIFGLMDLVGIDLMPRVAASMIESLPPDDPYVRDFREHDLVRRMIEEGYTGRKGKGGFYRLNREGGGKVKESIDLATGDYAPSRRSELESARAGAKDLRALAEHSDRGGAWAWRVLSNVIGYSAALVPEIADSVADVDAAMRLGYAWKWGPFELADRLGPAYVAGRLRAEGRDVPALLDRVGDGTFYRVADGRLHVFGADGGYRPVERPDGVLLLEDIKRAAEPLESNASASLWDIGDGVACFEVHTRMNALDPDVVTLLQKSLKLVEKEYRALVLYNEGTNFSVGANLGLALFAANVGVWPMIEGMLENGQKAMKAMKYAAFPVVAAPSGMALGGGCELLLHAAAVQAHAETYAGLVEAGVGVLPGWGGCKEMLVRHTQDEKRPNGPLPPVAKSFEYISTAAVAKSAQEARDMHILREGDGITMNRDRLLYDAKRKALSLLDGYEKPEPVALNLPGPNGRAALDLAVEGFALQGVALPHDRIVAGEIATVLTGGATDVTETVSEDRLFALERESFMKLLKTEPTLARIEHMLDTGKPLRN